MRRLPLAFAAIAILLAACQSKTPIEPATVETTLIPPIVTPPVTRTSAEFVADATGGPVQMTLFFQLKSAAASAQPVTGSAVKTCAMQFDGELRTDRLDFWVFKAVDDASCGTGRLPIEGKFSMRRSPAIAAAQNPGQPLTYDVTGNYTMPDGSQGAVNATLTGSLDTISGLSGTLTTRVNVPDPPTPAPPVGSATVVYALRGRGNPSQPDRMEVTFQLESAASSAPRDVFCSVNMAGRLGPDGLDLILTGRIDPPDANCSLPPYSEIALPLESDAPTLVRGRWRFFGTYSMPSSRDWGGCEGVAVGAPPSDAILQDVVCRHQQRP